jgi:N-acetylmuramoyl-L-alanine amidase
MNKKIVLNAGHHGIGTGAAGNGVDEFIENVYCCGQTMIRLASVGYNVMIVENNNLNEIEGMFNHWKPDLFISIHHNSFETSDANGSEICYFGSESEKLAKVLEPFLKDNLGLKWRGLKRRPDLRVLKQTDNKTPLDVPTVLIEGGFVSNDTDAIHIAHPTWPDRVATALLQGINKWFEID